MARKPKSEELRAAFGSARSYFLTAGLFSLGINLLYLAAPLYMLQIYDRVISSGSVTTLVMLTLVLVVALFALFGLDVVRARIMTRLSVRLDRLLAGRVVAATIDRLGDDSARSQPLRDFDTFRQFVTGGGSLALFDLPWAPIYIGVIFLLHPWLGLFALVSSLLLVALALLNERLVREPLAEGNEASAQNYSFTEMGLRNAEVAKAMGMVGGLLNRWSRDRNRAIERQVVASDCAATMTGTIKFVRMLVQSLILGLGAYLAIERLTTVGAMFAASILLGRAMQPVEQTVGQWRALVSARGAWARVRDLLLASPPAGRGLNLPRPLGRVVVEDLVYLPKGRNRPVLRHVSFSLEPGESLGIIGPSGAGKSTLARHLMGLVVPTSGAVRLDGADVSGRPHEQLGRHVGYLPQDVELFADTVAANIGRFQTDADEAILEAARLAGVHEMILRLPNGYDTHVGDGGEPLSGGYRQRIALARAVFGNPAFVLLDEPSSNLDAEGDQALTECVLELKQRGTTVVIVSHRPVTLSTVDKILVLRDGAVEFFGGRGEYMKRVNRGAPTAIPANTPTPAVALK